MIEEKNNGQLNQTGSSAQGSKESKSVFDVLPSKTSFYAGLAAGMMGFATIGFVVVLVGGMDWSKLGMGRSGDAWNFKKPAANANGNANANTNAPAPSGANLDKLPPITASDYVRGDLSKAKLVMVEYSDFECPFCKSFHSTIKSASSAYGTDVAWVYRHFPLSFHQNAQKEAEAAECVGELGGNKAFWDFSDKIYERTTSNGTGFALEKLGALAKEVGVNQAKFQSCLDSGKYAQKVQDAMAGGSAAGVDGTPGTILITKDGRTDLITGAQPLATVKAQIDALLK